MFRPLTLKENVIARIEDENLFNYYLATFTGVVSKNGLYKISSLSKKLILSHGLEDYDSFEGDEVNLDEVTDKELWLISMGGNNKENNELYNKYKASYLQHLVNKYEFIVNKPFYDYHSPKEYMRPEKKHMVFNKPELGGEENQLHYIELSPAFYYKSDILLRESNRCYKSGVNFVQR